MQVYQKALKLRVMEFVHYFLNFLRNQHKKTKGSLREFDSTFLSQTCVIDVIASRVRNW